MNMNVLVLQKRMSLSNVKLPNIDQNWLSVYRRFSLNGRKKLYPIHWFAFKMQEYCVNEFPAKF